MHRHFGAASIQRLRVRVADISGNPVEPATAPMDPEAARSGHWRDAGMFGGVGGSMFRQGLRIDISRSCARAGGGRRNRDRPLVVGRNAVARDAMSRSRHPAWLRD